MVMSSQLKVFGTADTIIRLARELTVDGLIKDIDFSFEFIPYKFFVVDGEINSHGIFIFTDSKYVTYYGIKWS